MEQNVSGIINFKDFSLALTIRNPETLSAIELTIQKNRIYGVYTVLKEVVHELESRGELTDSFGVPIKLNQ